MGGVAHACGPGKAPWLIIYSYVFSLKPKLSRRRYASVSYALQNNTVFRRAQNWVSASDGSRTDNESEFQSVGPETAWSGMIFTEVTENERIKERHPLSKAIDRYCTVTGKRSIGCKLVLFTDKKSHIRAFDWYEHQWPWIALNGRTTPYVCL